MIACPYHREETNSNNGERLECTRRGPRGTEAVGV
jgi:hypothetical protein